VKWFACLFKPIKDRNKGYEIFSCRASINRDMISFDKFFSPFSVISKHADSNFLKEIMKNIKFFRNTVPLKSSRTVQIKKNFLHILHSLCTFGEYSEST
jgi:hypothetical protein